MKPSRLRGVYAITDGTLIPHGSLITRVAQAIQGGADVIQYREKKHPWSLRRRQGAALRELCAHYGTVLIINDDITLAKAVKADGVHLGKDDGRISEARRVLGEEAIIGVSCYNDLQRATQAQAEGADYVAFGRFFRSVTKPNAVQADEQLLSRAKAATQIPVAAIGGITPHNGAPLVKAGADLLAVIHGIFGQADVTGATRAYADLF